eukprot:TRINITY_DN9636_c0_g1_i2.p1 TRINITY_DN9636_c0_g1~~TRINITY_DN9636_c0_g1_i2.p1  ORF type:complete len:383 (-),score=52.84 TRINITY_DN9636_c0_g1_i2:297-1382(-)
MASGMELFGLSLSGKDLNSATNCVLYGLGIITSLGVYGVIQERIMTIPYDGVVFKTSVFMVLCNRLWAVMYACLMVKKNGESYQNVAPLWKYLAISFSNVAATFCQYEALKWVSFPVQMLGKSFKMMPVMVWSIVISGKKYTAKDWAIAGAVTFGVTEFLMTGNISSKKHKGDHGTSIYGLLLLLGFLACDGFTSTFQEKLFAEGKGSKYNQMLYVNLGSAVVSLLTLLFSGGLFSSLSFCADHPLFLAHAMSLSAAAVLGQYCIYSQVKEFGALVFAMTMNLRQVISILVSYVMYGHSITMLQVFGLTSVFGALFFKSASGFLKPKETPKPAGFEKVPQTDVELSATPHPEKLGADAVGK